MTKCKVKIIQGLYLPYCCIFVNFFVVLGKISLYIFFFAIRSINICVFEFFRQTVRWKERGDKLERV
jgi:hypothetical protein